MLKKGDIFTYPISPWGEVFFIYGANIEGDIRGEALFSLAGVKSSGFKPKSCVTQASGHWWNLSSGKILKKYGSIDNLENKESVLAVFQGNDVESKQYLIECIKAGTIFKK